MLIAFHSISWRYVPCVILQGEYPQQPTRQMRKMRLREAKLLAPGPTAWLGCAPRSSNSGAKLVPAAKTPFGFEASRSVQHIIKPAREVDFEQKGELPPAQLGLSRSSGWSSVSQGSWSFPLRRGEPSQRCHGGSAPQDSGRSLVPRVGRQDWAGPHPSGPLQCPRPPATHCAWCFASSS